MDWLLNVLYIVDENGNPDLLKSCLALFGLVFMLYFLLDMFYIIRSSIGSVKV